MVDLLKKALELIEEDSKLILNETFMMGIFDELIKKLLQLADCIQHTCKSKQTALMAVPREKVIPLHQLREIFFSKVKK